MIKVVTNLAATVVNVEKITIEILKSVADFGGNIQAYLILKLNSPKKKKRDLKK